MDGIQLQNLNQLAPTLEPLAAASDSHDVRSTMDRLAAAGFRFVQLSATQPGLRPRELDKSARRDLIATFRRREVSIAGVDAWIPPQHFLDPVHADRAVSAIKQAIEYASDLGRVPVSISLPTAKDANGGDATAAIVEALGTHADRFGTALADHAIPFVARSGTPIGLGIDPAAWLAHGDDPAAAVSRGSLHAARLCDLLTSGLRGPIGDRQQGRLDVLAYKVALSINGFAGPVVLDARQWHDPWAGLRQSKSVWENVA